MILAVLLVQLLWGCAHAEEAKLAGQTNNDRYAWIYAVGKNGVVLRRCSAVSYFPPRAIDVLIARAFLCKDKRKETHASILLLHQLSEKAARYVYEAIFCMLIVCSSYVLSWCPEDIVTKYFFQQAISRAGCFTCVHIIHLSTNCVRCRSMNLHFRLQMNFSRRATKN